MTPTHKNGTCTPFSILKFHKNRSTELNSNYGTKGFKYEKSYECVFKAMFVYRPSSSSSTGSLRTRYFTFLKEEIILKWITSVQKKPHLGKCGETMNQDF